MNAASSDEDVAALRRAVQRLARRLRTQRPTDGLTDTELRVMALLLDEGPLTSAGLAVRARTTPQALTRSIGALVRAGLLDRRPHPHDNRQHLLTISAAGWAALRADAAPRDAWLAAAMDAVLCGSEPEVLAIAARLLDKIARYDPAGES